MESSKTAVRSVLLALAALIMAGLVPHSAYADGDKGKDKGKKGPVVIIGPITTTNDPPPKKK